MNEMVERGAQAMYEADGHLNWAEETTLRSIYLARTRAAIEPMRDPTAPMVEAFYRACERPLSPDRWESKFSNAMEAMIDEALRENPERPSGEA